RRLRRRLGTGPVVGRIDPAYRDRDALDGIVRVAANVPRRPIGLAVAVEVGGPASQLDLPGLGRLPGERPGAPRPRRRAVLDGGVRPRRPAVRADLHGPDRPPARPRATDDLVPADGDDAPA